MKRNRSPKSSKNCPPNKKKQEKPKNKPPRNRSKVTRDKKQQNNNPDKPKEPEVEKRTLTCRRYEQYHDKYINYKDITEFLLKLQKENPDKVKLQQIGTSTKGRPIIMVQITLKNYTKEPKLCTMIEAGLNGSDLMAVSNALYVTEYLVRNQNCAKIMDYYVLPCSNPDGYENAVNAMKENSCFRGDNVQMDLSQNFPTMLGLCDVRNISTREFLEKIRIWKEKYNKDAPESQAVISTIMNHISSIKLFISLQGRSEKICYPYGFGNVSPVGVEDFQKVAKSGRNAVRKRCFQYGSIYEMNGLHFGSIIDFLLIEQSTLKFAYILHVGDNKIRRECDCKNMITSNGEDIVVCILAMACSVFRHYVKTADADDAKIKEMTNFYGVLFAVLGTFV